MERVWGGRDLETKLGRTLPPEKVIGESWEIVDRADAQSVDLASGKSLRELIETHAKTIMGSGWDPKRQFPILVKWLDCKERLSLQVHPPKTIAPELGGEPKTENWYIADSEEGAGLLVGLVKGATREAFESALRDQALEPLVHRVVSETGDSILVESGRIHAIDGGNLILEIQQNSDTTYRVYDWGRVGLDGKPRDLHIEESLKSIDFEDFEPELLKAKAGSYTLADCAEFRIRKIELTRSSEPFAIAAQSGPKLLHVVEGSVVDEISGASAKRGDNLLLPDAAEFSLSAESDRGVFLLTDRFV
jgi:mannose-6-phosphate isomerase